DLLDTSARMLQMAAVRARSWAETRKVTTEQFEGVIDSLIPRGKRYDLIVTCSVLHHIPDLGAFLRTVRGLQKSGGVFIHTQDPNGDFLSDALLRSRTAEVTQKAVPEWLSRFAPSRVIGRIARELTGSQDEDYLSRTNQSLVS